MFVRENGEEENIHPFAATASSAMSDSGVVAFVSGLLVPATSSTAADTIAGVLVGAIASTDSDYATSAKIKPVDVPRPRGDRFLVDVNASDTIAQANVGTFCDLGDALTIKPNTNAHHHVFIERLVNTTGGANGTGQAIVTFPSQVS